MNREWTAIELNESFDLAKRKAWFMDGVHTIPRWPVHPLDHVWPKAERGLTWACERISHPQCRGWMWRTRDGSAFLSPIMVTDPEERARRQGPFSEALKPFIEDFRGLWDQYKTKWEASWEKAFAFDIENASDIDLEDFYRDLVLLEIENWKDHFYIMEGVGSLTLLFEDLASELCGVNSSSPVWSKLCSGFESKAFESDAKMWELANAAKAAGLSPLFASHSGQALVDQIKAAPQGDAFLAKVKAFLSEYGLRLVQLLNYASPSWQERPDVVLDLISIFVTKDDAFLHETMKAKAVTEREEAERELLAKVPGDQKEWFQVLLSCAQNWGWWSEEHEFWLNEPTYCLLRRVMLEYGKRFVVAGTFDQVDDIFHIRELDFERVVHHPADFNLRPEVAKHRAELAAFGSKETQPVVSYDNIPGAVEWLMQMREFHVALSMGYMPEPKEGVNASLWGTCGCPGTAEGVARVVRSDEDLHDIQPGDIVVCPTTYVTWTPIFSMIGGLVVDRGGSLSHSAICSREYGVPCVMNTFTGTSQIKTGQKIKIQADIGAVFVANDS